MDYRQLLKIMMAAEARERNLEKRNPKKIKIKKKIKRKISKAAKRKNRGK